MFCNYIIAIILIYIKFANNFPRIFSVIFYFVFILFVLNVLYGLYGIESKIRQININTCKNINTYKK